MGSSTLTSDLAAATVARQVTERATAPADSPRWPRRMTEAAHRVTELVVRHLQVSRCAVWLTRGQPPRIECLDSYSRVDARHSRLGASARNERASLWRALESRNLLIEPGLDASSSLRGDLRSGSAVQLPAGVSSLIAVGLHRGAGLSAVLVAEHTEGPRTWSEAQIRFMQTMALVAGDITCPQASTHAVRIDRHFVDGLPIVAYRCALTERGWIVGDVSEGAARVLGQPALHFIGGTLESMRRALRESSAPASPGNPCDLPSELPTFEHRYRRVAPSGAVRHFVEQGSVGVDPQSQQPVIDGVIIELTPPDANPGGSRIEAGMAQTDLLSHMSHELRTPLNAILGFAQLIEIDPDNRSQRHREYLTQIRSAGRYLLDLITHTLELSRIDADSTHVDVQPVCVSEIVADCVAMLTPQAATAGVQLIDQTGANAQAMAQAEPRCLRQVLLNLISNAVKYNRRNGRVLIDLTVTSENLLLRVVDTGLGIAEEQITSLFQPFNRLGREGGSIEGAGLGLAITRQLVQAMHASLSVSSRPDAGSCFELTLPRSAMPPPA